MAFRKPLRRIPESVKRKRVARDMDKEMEFQRGIVGPLMGFDEEGLAADKLAEEGMKRCICPKKKCPIHPD